MKVFTFTCFSLIVYEDFLFFFLEKEFSIKKMKYVSDMSMFQNESNTLCIHHVKRFTSTFKLWVTLGFWVPLIRLQKKYSSGFCTATVWWPEHEFQNICFLKTSSRERHLLGRSMNVYVKLLFFCRALSWKRSLKEIKF